MANSNLSWKLTDLYQSPDDPHIPADFAAGDTLISQLKKFRGKISNLPPAELLSLIKLWEELAFLFHKISLFAGLTEATNVGVDTVTRFTKHVEEQLVQKGQEIIFLEVEMAHLDEKTWQTFLQAKELQPYQIFLHDIYEQSKHTLSEPEEKILAEKSQTSSSALDHLFQITTNTLTFDWQGKNMTLEEVVTKFRDPDPTQRKEAAMVLHQGLKVNDKTTPAILNSLVQDKAISDRLRHFTYPEEARFMNEQVDRETVAALVKAVDQSADLVNRYYTLKKRIFKTDQMYWWDRYAPLPATKTTIKLAEAKTMVLDSFAAFSPDVAAIAEGMFKQNHIDWLPSPTKRGGAFCAFGGQDIYPYVLLNYTNTLRDVTTLAHELGHAIHDVLAQQDNVFFQTHPSLALAEIASTFSESLLYEKIMKSDIPKDDKISLTMGFIEDTFATVHRQITMFQFEQKLHERRRQEGELAKNQIDDLWHETMQRPFASSLVYTDEHKNTWMYVSHIFEQPFYVFSYAFAQLCVLALVRKYKEQGQKFVPTYLKLLKAGGSLSPKDNLKLAGLDITQPTFWQDGLTVLDEYITSLEQLTVS